MAQGIGRSGCLGCGFIPFRIFPGYPAPCFPDLAGSTASRRVVVGSMSGVEERKTTATYGWMIEDQFRMPLNPTNAGNNEAWYESLLKD